MLDQIIIAQGSQQTYTMPLVCSSQDWNKGLAP